MVFQNVAVLCSSYNVLCPSRKRKTYHNILAFGTVKDRQPMGSTPFLFDRIFYQPRFFERKTYFSQTHPLLGHKMYDARKGILKFSIYHEMYLQHLLGLKLFVKKSQNMSFATIMCICQELMYSLTRDLLGGLTKFSLEDYCKTHNLFVFEAARPLLGFDAACKTIIQHKIS